MTVTRFEFIPFEVGIPLRSAKLKETLRRTAAQHGWFECTDSFNKLDLNIVVPNCIGIFQRDNFLCYFAESGFAAFRVESTYTSRSAERNCAWALIERMEFQASIERNDLLPSLEILQDFIVELRRCLERRSPIPRLRSKTRCRFEYSLSVFAVSEDLHENLKLSLLNPRSVGCGVTQRGPDLPDIDTVLKNLQQVGNEELNGKTCTTYPGTFYSSWSSVVFTSIAGSSLSDLVALCEFRVQSTWLTAFEMTQRASNIPQVHSGTKQGQKLLNDIQEFSLIKSRVGQRLGANSPHDATMIVSDVVTTSELTEEIARADAALELAQRRVEFASARHQARGKRILELFGLIFAASGLAQLMIPLPITADTFTSDLVPLLLWILITMIGIAVVLRQKF